VRRERVGSVLLVTLPVACSAAPPSWLGAPSSLPEPSRHDDGEAQAAPPAAPTGVEPGCAADPECGYDPTLARCLADPRANPQPPIVDQGVVCYCEAGHDGGDPHTPGPAGRCAALRVLPVPCESDASCAVSADPRPHPIPSDRAHPHERGRPCHDFVLSTTCERTNLCTMHRLSCPRR
jgi:hypothetical protein